MSFLHSIHVGFFEQEHRDLRLDECKKLLARFQAAVPLELQLELCEEPRGDPDRQLILAYAGGFPVLFKRGTLVCPYLATEYNYPSIAFAVYVHLSTGSEIYSYDEGRCLTVDEIIPKTPFSDVMREVMARGCKE